MISISLFFMLLEPSSDPFADSNEKAQEQTTTPWTVLSGKRLRVKLKNGFTAEGTLLGVENDNIVLEMSDGTVSTVNKDDVENVKVVKDSVVDAPPIPPPVPAPVDIKDEVSESHKSNEEYTKHEIDHDLIERKIKQAKAGAIVGGIFGVASALSSIAVEIDNIHIWSESENVCGYDDLNEDSCGWTYEHPKMPGRMAAFSTFAFTTHIVAGPSILVPTSKLRNHTNQKRGKGRRITSWVLWGVGISSLIVDQTFVWRAVASTNTITDSNSPQCPLCGPPDKYDIISSRGAPPSFYIISAGLTLASTVLGLIDAKDAIKNARTSTEEPSAKASIKVFPVSLTRGAGIGISGQF